MCGLISIIIPHDLLLCLLPQPTRPTVPRKAGKGAKGVTQGGGGEQGGGTKVRESAITPLHSAKVSRCKRGGASYVDEEEEAWLAAM